MGHDPAEVSMLGRPVEAGEYGRLEFFEVDRPVRVTFHTEELQALCPAVEGLQPDIYDAEIAYTARTHALESKSLKLWLVSFRDRRIFAEHLVVEIHDVLAPGGVYVLNLIDHGGLDFARAEAATLRDVFAHVAVIAPLARLQGDTNGGNFVLVASDAPLPVAEIAARNAGRGDDDTVWSSDADLGRFVDHAVVLTDEYAPVDQLITPAG